MAKEPNATQTKKVQATISAAAYERLEWLATEVGLYGVNPAEVAKHLIVTGLHTLMTENVLPRSLPKGTE